MAPLSIGPSPNGRTIVDFGQNLVGHVRLEIHGEAGTTITLRHAEVLDDGDVATRPLRGAAAVDRYVEVDGWPGSPRSNDVRAVVVHTDMARTGWFDCSEPLLNRLHENVVWTMSGNFMDVPTDCPQRDERLGWTGDLAVFAPSATFLYDCSGMLAGWLADVAIEQRAYGTVPLYVPWFRLTFPLGASSVWGDAAVLVPWLLYQRFGDPGLLRRQYESMKAWVDQIAAIAGPSHLWQSGLHLGDWLDPSAPADAPEAARTDRYFAASAYHALSAGILAQAAAVLGEVDDARRYGELAAAIRKAFEAEYVSANGLVVCDAQTAYALALEMDLLSSEAQRQRAGRRLADLVRANDHKIGTGFVGARPVCDALTNAGAIDTAYHMLMQRDCPSWLYPVTMGATTMWERWDRMLPDGASTPATCSRSTTTPWARSRTGCTEPSRVSRRQRPDIDGSSSRRDPAGDCRAPRRPTKRRTAGPKWHGCERAGSSMWTCSCPSGRLPQFACRIPPGKTWKSGRGGIASIAHSGSWRKIRHARLRRRPSAFNLQASLGLRGLTREVRLAAAEWVRRSLPSGAVTGRLGLC